MRGRRSNTKEMTITKLTDSQWSVAETVLWCFVRGLRVGMAEKIACFVSQLMNMLRRGENLIEKSVEQ